MQRTEERLPGSLTSIQPSAKPFESRLILVTARAAVVLTNEIEIEPGHSQRKMICSVEMVVKLGGFAGVLRAGAAQALISLSQAGSPWHGGQRNLAWSTWH